MRAVPKPTSWRIERTEAKREADKVKQRIIRAVKKRDRHRCRVPGCTMQRWYKFVLDAAHIRPAGMGGNPTLSRFTTENMVSVCRYHHKMAFSLHSGHIKPRPETDKGANGPIAWWMKFPDGWRMAGIT
jgi:hypothetical protein